MFQLEKKVFLKGKLKKKKKLNVRTIFRKKKRKGIE